MNNLVHVFQIGIGLNVRTTICRNDGYPFESYDYVVDAVDTVTAKIEIIMKCRELGVPVISSMGTGNKMDPSKLQAADIYKTSVCPLARVMRRELKSRGVKHQKVVYSTEEPVANHRTPGSVSFVPASAGLLIASVVVQDILKDMLENGEKNDGVQI